MSEKMRIGELLLLKEKIDPWLLSHTLKEQATSQQRLVSMLVGRAQLDPDDGALLLSEQMGYPAALQRHLERRDPSVLELLPPQLGARWVVLPLGRARTGAVVVVARDPTPILSAALEHAMRTPVVLAITPSVQLERLVCAAYGAAGGQDEPLPASPPTLSDIGDVVMEDDTPLPIRRARTVSYMFKGLPDLLRGALGAPIDATLEEIDRAITATAVERLVMAHVAKRWRTSLLLRVDGSRATGLRGHNLGTSPDGIALSLVEVSSVSRARETRRVITEELDSGSQQHLRGVLGPTIAAAPVIASGRVVAVLAVGAIVDPSIAEVDASAAVNELDRLADALGAAYDRFSR